MSHETARAALRIPIFLLVCSVVLLIFEPRGSAEFDITVVTVVIALLFAASILLVARVFRA